MVYVNNSGIANYDNSNDSFIINDKQGIIGRSENMLNVFKLINILSSKPTPVLINGETGTGKELAAKAIHALSKRGKEHHPLVVLNCPAVPSELFESTLFGHEKGAFTGAHAEKEGLLYEANKGTLFLDEIGELPLALQSKLLRSIEEHEYMRVGGSKIRKSDFRVICATNRDLIKEVKNGRFREDLFYRLNVCPFKIPPLRERKDDIPPMINHFISVFNQIYRGSVSGFSRSAIERIMNHDWPGNVRELKNVIERTFVVKGKTPKGQVSLEEIIFDDESVSRIILESESLIESAEETLSSNQRWYEKGVLPMPLNYFRGLEGAYPYEMLHSLIYNKKIGSVYSEIFKNNNLLVFLTKRNLNKFFLQENEQFNKLFLQISENQFNKIVHSPFKIYSTESFRNEGKDSSGKEIFHSITSLTDRIKSPDVAKIPYKDMFYFAVTPNDVEKYVVLPMSNSPHIEVVKQRIVESYERFKKFSPK